MIVVAAVGQFVNMLDGIAFLLPVVASSRVLVVFPPIGNGLGMGKRV